MDTSMLFWLFFILIALQPVLRQRMLDAARHRLIGKLEKERGSRVILLVHRQETMSILGFPLLRYIDVHDSEEVLRAIHLTDADVPIDIVLHTPGGLVLAATQIARAIQARPGKVTVFVPHHAMSGGTLIALSADEIVMAPHAVLGPVDPQIGQHPAASVLRVLREKPIAEIDDETIVLADQAEKAMRQIRRTVEELLAPRMEPERAKEVAELLSEGTWTHDHPLRVQDLEQLGIAAAQGVPDDVMRLMALYPQPVRRQPTVEYLPGPRRSPRPKDHAR